MISDYSNKYWKRIAKLVLSIENSKIRLEKIVKQLYKMTGKSRSEEWEKKVKELSLERDQLKERIIYLEAKLKELLK